MISTLVGLKRLATVASLLVLMLFLLVEMRAVDAPTGQPVQACAPTAADPDGLRMPCFR